MSKPIIDRELKAENVICELSLDCTKEEFAKRFMSNYPDDVSRVKNMFISQGHAGLKLDYLTYDYFERMYGFAKTKWNAKKLAIEADKRRFIKVHSDSALLYYLANKKLLHHIDRVVNAKHDNSIKVFYFNREPEVLNHIKEYNNIKGE